MAGAAHGDVWESGFLECFLPSAVFHSFGEWSAVGCGEDEFVWFDVVAVDACLEGEPCFRVEWYESDAFVAFGRQEPVVRVDSGGFEPCRQGRVAVELLECVFDLDAVDSVDCDEFRWGQPESFSAWRMPVLNARVNISVHMARSSSSRVRWLSAMVFMVSIACAG